MGKAINEPRKLPQNVSYTPCRIAGIVIAKKCKATLYLGYSDANEIK